MYWAGCHSKLAPSIPGHSVCCTWPLPCPSPHLLRGDTALSLPASCTHLMFLCRFSCGLVRSQAPILFDSPGSPGSHTNCGFVSKRAISRETGSDKSKKSKARAPDDESWESRLITHPLPVHCAVFLSGSSPYPSRDVFKQQTLIDRRPCSCPQSGVPGTPGRLYAKYVFQQLAGPMSLCRPGHSRISRWILVHTSGCVFLLDPP